MNIVSCHEIYRHCNPWCSTQVISFSGAVDVLKLLTATKFCLFSQGVHENYRYVLTRLVENCRLWHVLDPFTRLHSYFSRGFSERSKEYVSHPSHVVLQCDATLQVCKHTFPSIIQRAKALTTKNKKGFCAAEPIRQHNNGDSLNMKESHVFLLSAARPIVYTERRETHWVQLLCTIWASQSLTHLHCCSCQNFPPQLQRSTMLWWRYLPRCYSSRTL